MKKNMGATITQYGKTVKEVLGKIRTQVKAAYPMLQPDGDVALIQKAKPEQWIIAKIFKVELKTNPDQSIKEVTLIETPKGNVGMATAVSGCYSRNPENSEYMATVHLD